MRDRDNNETGQSHKAQLKPETPRLEEVISPLTMEDYGVSAELQHIATLIRSGRCIVTATRKVDADSRYVVEIEAVMRTDPSLMLDAQSLGGEV
ncbi:hypothetical protein Ahp2_86 [Aeromonas phage Ahp2]|nr:hypothetical protein Ahp2_86 [Aeromonas phage Ahp2]